jgi:hypothetical protein
MATVPGRRCLDKTFAGCDMYRDLELYRTREGRVRAGLNRQRHAGKVDRRANQADRIFAGG